MPLKEAKARIKINRLLREAGWRLEDNRVGKANVVFESHVKITQKAQNDLGEDFENTSNGFIDYLLLDDKGYPLIVLEAKSESKNPLVGKEQARKYAKNISCRFVLLSNGNIHYFWDLEKGSPYIITRFPEPTSVKGYSKYKPNPERLVNELVRDDYIAATQMPQYADDPNWQEEDTREAFIHLHKLRFLRDYQIKAIRSIQEAVKTGQDRFLFEMATGTGKTLTAAAIIKLFLRTGNANRVLFLVDRLELEDQAKKAFTEYMKNDYQNVIYKENRDDWRRAEIVVTTVQSLLFNDKYKHIFSPTDFDLVISDEAHRSIGGNARAVFEYFIGYKLGLTATPKDYLKKYDPDKVNVNTQREYERRLLLDTYRTFGCESGQPTFRYSLIDGVKDGYLINPVVVDARTDVTTQLLSDEGYAVVVENEEGQEEGESFFHRDFEKKFFSEDTNRLFCSTFLKHALKDPISNEIGKTIVFAVSQNHAAKLTQVFNQMADKMYPGKYKSDFVVQVTSVIPDAQQYTINFSDKSNNLMGTANFQDWYKTSKTRVCVTVGMMTTGYDCTDILNVCLMRPIFSPTDFVQIKGRGTRRHKFADQVIDPAMKKEAEKIEKEKFKLFDFFGNCEYFEEKYDYDEVLKLPQRSKKGEVVDKPTVVIPEYEREDDDHLQAIHEEAIGLEGMKIDRMFFEKFEDTVKEDDYIRENVMAENWDKVLDYLQKEVMNKPKEYFTPQKLRKSLKHDRKVTLREMLEYIFGLIPSIKSKDELLEDEFYKFISDYKPSDTDDIIALKYFFKTYIVDETFRKIIDEKRYAELAVNPVFPLEAYKAIPKRWREIVPEYVYDYVSLNKYAS
ncbi:MAG: DEAD/DEAH box helicase family protein [Bacteroidota bacterium]|nr:DEAD/DEAH box helicase family protein [Bacteroidota bacterium]